MLELILFIIGFLLGGTIGIVTMCLVQVNHLQENNFNRKDDDK